jgi:hypothetical protein
LIVFANKVMHGHARTQTTMTTIEQNDKQTRIRILENRIRAAEIARRWCIANGRNTGPTSREIHAAIAELKSLTK